MKKIKIAILTLVFLLPSAVFGQRGEVLLGLSDSFDHSKKALEYVLSAVENMTEAYKIGPNQTNRFIILIENDLKNSLRIVQEANERATAAQGFAKEMSCLTVTESANEAKEQLKTTQDLLSNAIELVLKAKETREASETDQYLKESIPPIEGSIKALNKAMDILNEAAYELNQCAD